MSDLFLFRHGLRPNGGLFLSGYCAATSTLDAAVRRKDWCDKMNDLAFVSTFLDFESLKWQ